MDTAGLAALVRARAGQPGLRVLSMRTLAERYQVHRRAVWEALKTAVPKERKKPPPRRSKWEPAYGWIDEMLRANLSAPRKQKHTTVRLYQWLITEHGFGLAVTVEVTGSRSLAVS